ncbi:bifunctional diguanylate cyclase/phosphodiesterase [Allorhizobium undicola]|uniref:bifunctional diguanylate cyclase/phosphodiesterase n=1 Tax=Allorhizobium undicola TaxID=78527 RepID=UPI003D329492
MLMPLQNKVLEMIAKGVALGDVLDHLCRTVERIVPDIVCSVLRLDDDGTLRHLAGPSLPEHYSQAINGLPIGPGVGSCGTAAYLGAPVLVEDIATHPYWRDFKALALPLGYLACWSTPIMTGKRVLGTFAFYYRSKRGPSEIEQSIIDACVALCAIAIEREIRIEERWRLANTDALTGLPNRARFNEVIAEKAEQTIPWGLLLVDLDNLKMVNDTFGHKAGDDMIAVVAERLRNVSAPDTVFRLGGDEFALIISGEDCADPGYHAAYILESFKSPCLCAGQTVYPSGTIGGAVARAGDSPDDVRQNADLALYEAKERCRGNYLEFGTTTGSTIARRYRSIQQVTRALHENRIIPYYQPVTRITDGKILGFEALCRMRGLNGEIIAASHFHEATRDVQTARDLTASMFRQVLADARSWLDQGLDFGRVGVNVSAADFLDGKLINLITREAEAAGISLSRLVIEVTESVYLGQREETVLNQIQAIRDSGVTIGLDDFGTGFASLTHLLTVPLNVIKIDKCFTEKLLTDRNAEIIVEALVQMCTRLGYDVIAEGIETVEQGHRLLEMGCLLGQGYLFSKAVPAAHASKLLQQNVDFPLPEVNLRSA